MPELGQIWQDYDLNVLEEGIQTLFPDRTFSLVDVFSRILDGDILGALKELFFGGISDVFMMLSGMKNIVLIGMPGAGKSTVSRRIAETKKKSALIEGDDIYGQIKGGYIDPWEEGNYLDTFWKLCLSQMKIYLEDGFDVVFSFFTFLNTFFKYFDSLSISSCIFRNSSSRII